MGSLWRSQEMVLAQLLLQSETVYDCVRALGEQVMTLWVVVLVPLAAHSSFFLLGSGSISRCEFRPCNAQQPLAFSLISLALSFFFSLDEP